MTRSGFAMVLLFFAQLCAAQYGDVPDLAPKTYSSPSGQVQLRVDPSARSGAGAAHYELRKGERLIRSMTLPYTLWDAAVADDGRFGGYGYSDGYESDVGKFFVAVFAADGQALGLEETPRRDSRFLHTYADPKGSGLFIDPANDRLVVRVKDPDENENAEQFWTFRLSSGKRVGTNNPRAEVADASALRFVLAAQPIAETPLTLIQWWRYESVPDNERGRVGTRFVLVDAEYRPIWSLEWRDDYNLEDEAEEDRLQDEIREQGAILDSRTDAVFALRQARTNERVVFSVAAEGEAADAWQVTEIAREPYHATRSAVGPGESPDTVQRVELSILGDIQLGGASSGRVASPIHDLFDFSIDAQGRFGFVRGDYCDCGEPTALVIVGRDGRRVREATLPSVPKGSTFQAIGLDTERWLVTASEFGRGKRAKAWTYAVDSGRWQPLVQFDVADVETLAAGGDGGFVVLSRRHEKYTLSNTVHAFDAQGRERWRIEEGSEDPAKLFSPEDIAVTTLGDIVVLDNIRKQLQVFDRDGRFSSIVKLAANSNYLSGVESDGSGGVVVYDFQGTPRFIQMRMNGEVIATWNPRFSDGRTFDLVGNLQAAQDGSFWTSDGHALLRIDARGEVIEALGGAPDSNRLGSVTAMAVTPSGRIHVADRRTGAVHVFDEQGRRLHVAQPTNDDYTGDLDMPVLAVSNQGEVFITRRDISGADHQDFLHYDEAGARLDVIQFPFGSFINDWFEFPNGNGRWLLGFTTVYRTDSEGELVRELNRDAMGQWLQNLGPAGVAPDGAIAVLSSGTLNSRVELGDNSVISLYSAEGEPLRAFPAPLGLARYAGDIAFDGTELLVPIAAQDSERAEAVLATDTYGRPLWRFDLPTGQRFARLFRVSLSARPELWLFDGESKLRRYALPAR